MQDRQITEKTRNGVAWLEYKSFASNSFDVMLYEVPFSEDYEVDLGLLDFDRETADFRWFYSTQKEFDEKKRAEENLEDLILEHFPGYNYDSDTLSSSEVSQSVLNAPEVYGNVLLEENVSDEDLRVFGENIFGQSLSSPEYDPVWIEGEELYD